MSRALVLGGGGPVGIAWESGLLNGLADGGVDVAAADFIMGTSAGSFVGARLAMGVDPRTFAAPFIDAPASPKSSDRPARPTAPAANLTGLMKLMAEAQSGAIPAEEAMKALGRYAREASTVSEEDFVASFGANFAGLPEEFWPDRPYACTAVDTESGEFKLWTADSKIGLKRAVASSCSVPGVYPPVTIGGRRYMDGGMRSGTNADLAKGHDKVLVVIVRASAAAGPQAERARARIDAELKTLAESGAAVEALGPDEASSAAMGVNLMDFRKRPAAAAAGLAQGRAQAAALKAFWG
jgi:NTE family protein